jgi:hypothetical protein
MILKSVLVSTNNGRCWIWLSQCSEGNVAVGFNGPRNYSGTLFTSGFSCTYI